jgi:hypothetical protein
MKKEYDKISRKICICDICKGTGIREKEEITSYHNRDYHYWNELCSHCDGQGRKVQNLCIYDLEIVLPDGKISRERIEKITYEKLNGRKTEEIYKIG